MRLAVLSDVHGNTPALRAVLAAVDRLRPDLIINLGDVASGAVDPRGTLDLLRQRDDILTLRGNHERQLLDLPPAGMGAVDAFTHGLLSDQDRRWMAGLPAELEPSPGVLAVHAAPGDDLRYLLETVKPSGLTQASDEEVLERLGDRAGRFELYLCGHTHLARTRRLPDGSLVVNPGSVGWPAFADDSPYPHVIESGQPHAHYAILERSGGGWMVDQAVAEYDFEAAARLAERHARPDIARALRTGRA